MDIADSIYCFFVFFCELQLALEQSIDEIMKCKRLKSICKTRWVEHHEVFEVFIDLYEPLVLCLESISESGDWNREIQRDARS